MVTRQKLKDEPIKLERMRKEAIWLDEKHKEGRKRREEREKIKRKKNK